MNNNNEIWSSRRIKELTMNKLPKKSVSYSKLLKRASILAAVAVVAAISTVGVYAAINYLKPSEVAERLHYPEVAEQFEIQTSFINTTNSTNTAESAESSAVAPAAVISEPESVTSGGYTFTLLGVTSGADLNVMKEDAEDGRTYAVVAIENADGTPFDSETFYVDMDSPRFFVSPLVHGREPWKGGAIIQGGGGAAERIIDGILYRLIDCDNIEIFADTGVSLAVSTGNFYSTEAFDYNAETGLTTAKDFDGGSAIFELPLDPALGDPQKAAAYWEKFEYEATQTAPELPPEIQRFESNWEKADWEDVTVVEGTTEILTPDEEGKVKYSYEVPENGGGSFTLDVNLIQYEIGVPIIYGGSEMKREDGTFTVYSTRLTFNEDGTVTAEVVIPNNL
ncbi:MAG: hypothetical protein LBL80_02630 [Ruminococcus sp.]|jgi:hypothetical protein|nr:hypothetical protein [Ruminococcus sp.]